MAIRRLLKAITPAPVRSAYRCYRLWAKAPTYPWRVELTEAVRAQAKGYNAAVWWYQAVYELDRAGFGQTKVPRSAMELPPLRFRHGVTDFIIIPKDEITFVVDLAAN